MQQKGILAKDELRNADLDDLLRIDEKTVSPIRSGLLDHASASGIGGK